MDPVPSICMISGDFNLDDGISKSVSLPAVDGVKQEDGFMVYASRILTSQRVFDRDVENHSIPVEVWVPHKNFFDKPVSVVANLQGRLYAPAESLLIADARYIGEDVEKKPIIEVVHARRYALKESEDPSIFSRPVVTLVGEVGSSIGSHPTAPLWKTFDLHCGVTIKGEYKRLDTSLLLTGLMTMWRPERHAFLFILAKFIVIENETKASLKVLYSDVLYGNAPVLFQAAPLSSNLTGGTGIRSDRLMFKDRMFGQDTASDFSDDCRESVSDSVQMNSVKGGRGKRALKKKSKRSKLRLDTKPGTTMSIVISCK